MNRLADESSLYLRQHAENPVDWYPWGAPALAAAGERDVPILLSIGYSSCHWCHVMAHESFEDPATANLMNERFVNVKVDREERPDVDALYMQATVAMSGHGGWPMTVFLTPAGEPFYAGTYFPPTARGGMPAFADLLRSLADAYANRRDDVVFQAGRIREALQAAGRRTPAGEVGQSLIADAMAGMGRAFDEDQGGFGGAPKFPPSLALEFLLRRVWADPGPGHAREMAGLTLRRMADGGIFDHVGGGFHRYAVDGVWLVPHFEKMLYDNALLARDYTLAARVLDEPAFGAVATRVLDYMIRELRLPNGGFAAAQDADTPEGEGAFFTWTPDQLAAVLDPDEAEAVALRFGVTDAGNVEDGATVLHVAAPLEEVSRRLGRPAEPVIAAALDRLYAARRADRAIPARDDKVLTAWNGLAIAALAEAGVTLARPDYLAAAAACAEFLLAELIVDGRLMRTHADGRAHHLGQLDDHANLCEGLLALYAADFDPRWPAAARAIAERMIALFADPDGAGFLFAGSDGEPLIAPVRDLEDQPTPSGNSQAARVMTRLAALTNDPDLADRARRTVASVATDARRFPHAFGTALIAADALLSAPPEVAIVGDPADPHTAELIAAARAGAGPHAAIAVGSSGAEAAAVPLLADRSAQGGRPTAYVCRNFACRAPVTDPAALRAQLAGA